MRRLVPASALFLVLFAVSACPVRAQVRVERAFPNLSFSRPVDLQQPGDGTDRLFVVEQQGRIRVFDNTSTASGAAVFLDIRARVNSSGNEEGLLGLAFHPEYKNNGFFYVNYTANPPRRTVISRFSVSASDPNRADSLSEKILLTFDQPYSNHNGGQIAFGPDGFLYIATGDGGSGGDPQKNGQNRKTLLGKILRIDVNGTSTGREYAIPADNPFVNNDGGLREEIWAWGMRNPWRFSFDRETGRLWAGDVGQNAWEEVDIIERGRNYGWNIMEGAHCYSPPTGCDTTGLVKPVVEYDRAAGVSITGGHVYRGSRVPGLAGKYIYADFGSGRIWSLQYDGPSSIVNTLLLASGLNISAFGVDRNRELYFCAFDGYVYTFTPSPADAESEGAIPRGLRLDQNFPNPVPLTLGTASVRFALPKRAFARVVLTDLLGRAVTTAVEGDFDAGSHSVALTTAGLAPGRYSYSLESEGVRITRGMVIAE